jgi:hypothetical protein
VQLTPSGNRRVGHHLQPRALCLDRNPVSFLISCTTATVHGSSSPAPTTASAAPSSHRVRPRPRHPQMLPNKLDIVSEEIRAKHSKTEICVMVADTPSSSPCPASPAPTSSR